MQAIIFYIILIFIVAEYGVSQWLSYCNRKAVKPTLPPQLCDLYNPQEYAKQQRYFKENERISFISETVSTLLFIAMFVTGAFGLLYNYIQPITDSEILQTLIYFGILFFAYDIISTPLSIYSTFNVEAQFGFNKTTPKTFIADKLKGWLITVIVGGGLIALMNYTYIKLTDIFWLVAFTIVTIFAVVMTLLYSQIIVPLFNKQTPLPDGELRTAIEKFAKEANFPLDNIYVIDGSKRSTKANAYFSGFGKRKRVVLYDTLINDLTTPEIVAVLAHEVGHNKMHHIPKQFALSSTLTLLQFYLLSYALASGDIAAVMGVDKPVFAISIIAFAMLYTPVNMITSICENTLSRRNEYQADGFAAKYGYGEELISALKKISINSLTNLTPNRLYVKVYYSHPTLLQRMANIREIEK